MGNFLNTFLCFLNFPLSRTTTKKPLLAYNYEEQFATDSTPENIKDKWIPL